MHGSGPDTAIELADAVLHGELLIPEAANGIVVFAHGSGSSRFSTRNRHVARSLREAAFGTLLFDLLTAEEEQADAATRRHRFDIELLARRLVAVTGWLQARTERALPLAYFGASTGAAAALVAAAAEPEAVRAVVSRGGRPDLAGAALERVRAPTMLIVGGRDATVLALNRDAFNRLECEKELVVVPGATHLFEEPGALDKVAREAARWFALQLLAAEPRDDRLR